MNYVYVNGYCIGYMLGDVLIRYSAPIPADLMD